MGKKKKKKTKPKNNKAPQEAKKSKKKKPKKPKQPKQPKQPKGAGIEYGVLKGTVVGGSREPADKTPHYQISVSAGSVTWRCPVNVKSSDGSEVLFFTDPDLLSQAPQRADLAKLWKKKISALNDLATGFTALPDHKAGVALDFQREKYMTKEEMIHLPASGPGANDDVQDTVDMLITRAKDQKGTIYVLGAKFGSGQGAGSGVHDIHMNQGNGGSFKKDNGVFQDGGLVITFPSGRHVAMLFAFQTQSWKTDASGNPA